MSTKHCRIESLGVYLPPTVQTTAELVSRMVYRPPFSLERLTGVRTRRISDSDDSLGLALRAATDCLSRSRYSASGLDVVISASITRLDGQHRFTYEPSFASVIARRLGARQAIHFDISNACAGMMTGVAVLDRMIRAGQAANGLVVSGELITPLARVAEREVSSATDQQLASLTVGDSGAAVVIDGSDSPTDHISFIELLTAARFSDLCTAVPHWDGGMAMYSDTRQLQARQVIVQGPAFARDVLARHGTTLAEEGFDYVIHHQIGSNFTARAQAISASILGTAMPPALTTYPFLGNTASTALFVTLHDHLKRNTGPAKYLIFPAASGIVTGCMSIQISTLAV